MADTVKLFGSPVKKTYVKIGAVVLVAAAGYGWYRNRQAGQAAAAAPAAAGAGQVTPGDQYPPDGTTGNPSDPYSTDPATGMTYGDEAAGGYDGTGVNGLGGFFGNPGLFGGGSGFEGPGEFTSNAYWTQYCEQVMGSTGDDSISAALGAYISGDGVTATEVSIIEQAIAIAGYPPVAGTNGYPPSIKTAPSGGSAQVAVPDVIGRPQEDAYAILQAVGLKPKGSPVQPGKVLTVDSQSPAEGSHVPAGSTVTLHSSVHGGKPAPARVKVPAVTGRTQEAAYGIISAAGLKPEGSKTVPGKVLTVTAQTPKAGTEAARGSVVHLTSKTR